MMFEKNMKFTFSDKLCGKEIKSIIENVEIIRDNQTIVRTLNFYFCNIAKTFFQRTFLPLTMRILKLIQSKQLLVNKNKNHLQIIALQDINEQLYLLPVFILNSQYLKKYSIKAVNQSYQPPLIHLLNS